MIKIVNNKNKLDRYFVQFIFCAGAISVLVFRQVLLQFQYTGFWKS